MDIGFWNDKIQRSYDLRVILNLVDSATTNCYRLINAEGDGLSGIIIDIYGQSAVIQCHTIGMYRNIGLICEALRNVYGDKIKVIYDKNKLKGESSEHSFLLGEEPSQVVVENSLKFNVDWVQGQKTGFFLDQRENRNLLKKYAYGRIVLNAFCYTGGFSVYAQEAGADVVDSVDVSERAVRLATRNMDLNKRKASIQRREIVDDVMNYLKECEVTYDLIVVDPPAFAKSQRKRHNAVQAYKRLNVLVFRKIDKDGIVFTFSCSQVVDRALFIDTIRAAAIEAGRGIQILHHLSQPADHPIDIFHREGEYLKGLVLRVT